MTEGAEAKHGLPALPLQRQLLKIETPRAVRPNPRPNPVTQLAFRYRERSVATTLYSG